MLASQMSDSRPRDTFFLVKKKKKKKKNCKRLAFRILPPRPIELRSVPCRFCLIPYLVRLFRDIHVAAFKIKQTQLTSNKLHLQAHPTHFIVRQRDKPRRRTNPRSIANASLRRSYIQREVPRTPAITGESARKIFTAFRLHKPFQIRNGIWSLVHPLLSSRCHLRGNINLIINHVPVMHVQQEERVFGPLLKLKAAAFCT